MVIKFILTMRNKHLYRTVFIALFAFALAACEDKIDPLIEEIEADRWFTPTQIATSNGETQAYISWSESLHSQDTATYELEVSKDLTFAVIEYSVSTLALQATITNEDIDIKIDHYARVRA